MEVKNDSLASKLYPYKIFILGVVAFSIILASHIVDLLPISLYPNSSKPTVRVVASYDMDATSFKEVIGKKMEVSLRNIEGATRIDAKYEPKKTTYYVSFSWDKSSSEAMKEVSTVASFYQSQLPQNYPPIKTYYYDAGLELYIAVKSNKLASDELSKLLEQRLLPILTSIPGISSVYVSPVDQKEVVVKVNPYALVMHKLSIESLIEKLNESRFDARLGTLQSYQDNPEYQVTLGQTPRNIQEIEDLVIDSGSGRLVRLKDLASVELQIKESSRYFYVDDTQVVAVAAWPLPDTNLYEISKLFESAVAAELNGLGEAVILNSPMNYIKVSLYQMGTAVLVGMIFTALSVFAFFRRLSATMIISLSMPISIVFGICMLAIFDAGINLVSVAAVGVASGLVVDSCVFVLERIRYKLSRLNSEQLFTLYSKTVFDATRQSVRSVLITSLTSIVVFFPLLFTQPIVKALIGELAIVIIILLCASVIFSLFVMPALILAFPNKSVIAVTKQLTSRNKTQYINSNKYPKTQKLLSNLWIRGATLGIVSYFCMHSLAVLWNDVKRDVIAQPLPNIIDVGLYFNDSELALSARKQFAIESKSKIEQSIGKQIKFSFVDIRKNVAYISLHLKNYEDAPEIVSKLKRLIEDKKEYSVDVSPWVSASVKIENTPDYTLYVPKADHANSVAQVAEIYRLLKLQDGVSRVKAYPKTKSSNIAQLSLDDSVVAYIDTELSYKELQNSLSLFSKLSIQEEYLYSINMKTGDTPLSIQIGSKGVEKMEHIEQLPIWIDDLSVNFGQLASFEFKEDYLHYHSRNGADIYMLEVWLNDDIQDGKTYLAKALEQNGFKDKNINIVSGNDEITSNISSLIYALYCSLLIIFLILLLDLKSISLCLIALSSIPIGLIGASYSLFYFDSTFSVNSLIGIIMLGGIGVNSSILIIHGYQYSRTEQPELNLYEHVITAVLSRLRPILITSISTVLGMSPLAYGLGNGGPIMQPLGLAMCGGMVAVATLSIVIIPMLLITQQEIANKLKNKQQLNKFKYQN